MKTLQLVDFVFDGPPGPTNPGFVECETQDGRSVRVGEWLRREDGYWVLRVHTAVNTGPEDTRVAEEWFTGEEKPCGGPASHGPHPYGKGTTKFWCTGRE